MGEEVGARQPSSGGGQACGEDSRAPSGPVPCPAPSPWVTELCASGDAVPTCGEGPLPSRVDLVIVGAGMTGCALAYHLQELSKRQGTPCGGGPCAPRVLVCDARCVSGGASGRNGGILWPSAEEPFELRTAQKLRAFDDLLGGGGGVHWVDGAGLSLVEGRASGGEGESGGGEGEEEEEEEEECLLEGLEATDPCAVFGARPGAFEAGYLDRRVSSFWPAKVSWPWKTKKKRQYLECKFFLEFWRLVNHLQGRCRWSGGWLAPATLSPPSLRPG